MIDRSFSEFFRKILADLEILYMDKIGKLQDFDIFDGVLGKQWGKEREKEVTGNFQLCP